MAKDGVEFPEMTYAATENGWMDSATFANYFEKSFLPAVEARQPVVLIYDGHSSHISLGLVEKATMENVVILKLPPHTSHLLQPMDLSVFKPLKEDYDNAVIRWQRKNYGVKMPKQEFSNIISRIWKGFNSTVIQNGFRKAGIFPINDKVIPEETFEPVALNRYRKMMDPRTDPRNVNPDATDMPQKKPEYAVDGCRKFV